MVAMNTEIDFSVIKDPISLTKEYILSIVSDEDIYRHYLGDRFVFKKALRSPLRNDNDPSFSLYPTALGVIKWKDHARRIGGDCFDFVQQLFGVDYKTALQIVNHDVVAGKKLPKSLIYGYGPSKTVKNYPIEKTKITITEAAYSYIDDEYWTQYGVSLETLVRFNVIPCHFVWINAAPKPLVSNKHNPIYAFEFYREDQEKPNYKIYRPYATTRADKWRSNCDINDVMGLAQLAKSGNVLFITKSMKDVMVLDTLGYNAISPQSESSSLPVLLVDALKQRFKTIILFFDNDEAGIRAVTRYQSMFDLSHSIFMLDKEKGSKDISDYTLNYGGVKAAKAWMEECLDILFPGLNEEFFKLRVD